MEAMVPIKVLAMLDILAIMMLVENPLLKSLESRKLSYHRKEKPGGGNSR